MSVGLTASARADSLVLLFDSEALRPSLCAALRIQLSGRASVRCLAAEAASLLPERIAAASRAVGDEHAELAVLLERDSDSRRVRMVLIGARAQQPVLAIETIEDRPLPDVDRSLALKVRDTLEATQKASALAPAAAPGPNLPAPEPASPVVPTEQAATPPAVPLEPLGQREPLDAQATRKVHYALLAEVSAALVAGVHTRAAGNLALGLRTSRERLFGELAVSAQLASALRAKSDVGRVREREYGLALSARAGRTYRWFALGAYGELGWLRADARGVTRDGSSTGEQALSLVRLGLGLDFRVVLLRGRTDLVLRAAPGLQVDPLAQRYQLDGQAALELGRVRAWLPLSLLIALPLGKQELAR